MAKISIIFLAILLAGCTFIPKASPSISTYDLGPARLSTPDPTSSPITIQIANISAPVWLDTQSIYYRLAYHDPARIYTYARSRWNAPPAQLLTERFKQYFATQNIHSQRKNHTLVNYLLKIDLEEFTQIFNTPDNSEAVIQLRATLYEPTSHYLIAQHDFLGKQTTQTADAAGAIAAFILVSDHLLNELIQWISNVNL